MSKFSEAIITRLGQAKRDGIQLKMSDVKSIIEEEEAKLVKPKRQSQADMTDEEWLQSLHQEEALRGVDIKREIVKCQFWCKQNKRQPTRRTIVNWLGNAEKVISLKAQGAQYATGLRPPPPAAPEGWKNWLLNNMPNDEHSAYGQLTTAINLSQFHLMPASWQARCQAGLIADMTGGLVEEVEMEQRYRQT